nr:PAC2 family protein [Desulfurococcales archaeon]
MKETRFEEEIHGFLFREYGDLGSPKYLIVGLPDVGLVGSIASVHLVRQLKLDDVIGVDSYSLLPPVVVVSNGEPKHPVRIYSNGDVAVIATDVPIPPASAGPLSAAIVQFARTRGIGAVISMTGVGNPMRFEMERPGLYVISSDEEASRIASQVKAEKLREGILAGPYALILKESVRKKLSNIVVMADAFLDIPDPEAAAVALEAVSTIMGVTIDTRSLLEEAERIKLRLKDLMKETKN